jgi:hypothetical protein
VKIMGQHNQEHADSGKRAVIDWRKYRGRRGRVVWGLLLAGVGGFWLTRNLTDNVALIAENPGRVVFPALVILLGIVAMFTKREWNSTDTE